MYAVHYYFDASDHKILKDSFEAELEKMSINFINRSEADGYEDDDEIIYEVTSYDKKSLLNFMHWTHYNIECAPHSFNVQEAEDSIEEI